MGVTRTRNYSKPKAAYITRPEPQPLAELAREFGFPRQTLSNISARENWPRLRREAIAAASLAAIESGVAGCAEVFAECDRSHMEIVNELERKVGEFIQANFKILTPQVIDMLAAAMLKLVKIERQVHGRDLQKVAVDMTHKFEGVPAQVADDIRDRLIHRIANDGAVGDRHRVPGASPNGNGAKA
jgi:hypothetical protein